MCRDWIRDWIRNWVRDLVEGMQSRVRISRRAADRVRAGHLWVYRSELGDAEMAAEPGALVTVTDAAGRALGTGLYSSASQIVLRLVSREAELTREQYLADVHTRIGQAFARRHVVAALSAIPEAETNAQRLLFSEADALPGIIADRYADLVIVQLLTQGTAKEDVRAVLVEALRHHLAPGGEPLTILERPDPRARELEELGPPPEGPLFANGSTPSAANEAPGASPTIFSQRTIFSLNGLRFSYDAASGQKTGAFLDQRVNYPAAAEWVRRSGRSRHALDLCTYHGGFALHLAQVCARVTGVDQSRAALETADRNLLLNPHLPAVVDWIEADAFEFLRALDDRRHPSAEPARSATPSKPNASRSEMPAGLPRHFDAIVLDPPAFAKSKRAAEGALRGYKELNLRAMRLLAPGGTLVTCSCSHHVSMEAFVSVVAEAAADAGRRVQLLETRAAAPDHPEVLTLPETRYLKCLICHVE